jgi:hypothetical protein
MGGLVARAAVHADMGAATGKVLGVIHGVMPAIGAASTYKRMRTGFEGDGSIKGWATRNVLGSNGQEVTAVLGHSPGGLQLLPNKKYSPEGWLKVEGITTQAYNVPILGNPYKNIYEEKNKWWRLVHPEWLDPNNKFANSVSTTAWDSYLAALESAEVFHDKLTAQYHSNSYVYFGSDTSFLSYGNVVWMKAGFMNENLLDSRRSQETKETLMKEGAAHMPWDLGTGRTASVIDDKHATFNMTDPRDPGDGTVPSVSGIAPEYDSPANIRFQCAISGIDHQSSYAITNTAVIKFVLYSACKITQQMT